VVNCAGALQDGPADDLEAVHSRAMRALALACQSQNIPITQISAVGANADADTVFLASKSRGDDAIRELTQTYEILKLIWWKTRL